MSHPDNAAAPAPRRWNFNTIIGLIAIALGIFIFIITPFEVERPRLLFGQRPSGLDPDFFPRLVAVFFAITGAWLIWYARSHTERNQLRELDRDNITSVVVTIAALFVFAVIFEPLGFVVASALLIGFLSTFYGNRAVIAGLAVSIGVPLLMYNIFRFGLKVVLPANPFIDTLYF